MRSFIFVFVAGAAFAQGRVVFEHVPRTEAPAGKAYSIEGTLSQPSLSSLFVQFRSAQGAYESIQLELQYGDLYRAVIPGDRMKSPFIEYFVEGESPSGHRKPLVATEERPVRVVIVAGPGDRRGARPRCKKGKKCKDEPPNIVLATSAPDEDARTSGSRDTLAQPAPSGEGNGREDPEPPPTLAAVPSDPRKEAIAPMPPQRAQESAPVTPLQKPVESSHPSVPARNELEDELALYSAEVSSAVVHHIDDASSSLPTRSMVVLTALQLRQLGVRYVYEALDLLPGVSVSRDEQGGYRVATRGLRGEADLPIVLNGQRLNAFYDGKALAQLPIDNLDRIELDRVFSGNDRDFGIGVDRINLVTRRDSGVRAAVAAGLWESFDGHLNAGASVSAFKVAFDLDVASQRGQQLPVQRDGLDSASVQRPKHTADGRFFINSGASAAWASASLGTFAVQGRFLYETRSALIGLFDVVGPDSQLAWLVGQAQLGWTRALPHSGSVSIRAVFDQQQTNRHFQLTPPGWQLKEGDLTTVFPSGVLEQVDTSSRRLGLDVRSEFSLFEHHHFSAGGGVDHQSIVAQQLLTNAVARTNASAGALVRPEGVVLVTEDGRSGRGPAADRVTLGAYLFDTWSPLKAVSIAGGLHFEVTQLPNADLASAWQGSVLLPTLGPSLGVTIAPVRSFVFRALYGRSVRHPTPEEFGAAVPDNDFNQGRFVGNPLLKSATFDAFEVGAEFVQAVGDGRLRLKGQGFLDRVTNAIAKVDTTGGLVPYANRPAGVQVLGLEGEARFEVGARFAVWVNALWLRAEDLGTPAQSRLLTDVAQIRMNGGLTLPLGPWLMLDLVGRFASERRNNSRSVLELIRRYALPANSTVSAQLRTDVLFDHLEFSILGQNVFASEYFDDAARPDRVTAGVPRGTWSAFFTSKLRF